MEKEIITYLYNFNIENLKTKRDGKKFYIFLKSIIKNSHFLIKFSYRIFICFSIFAILPLKLFFLPESVIFKYYKKLLSMLNLIIFFKDVIYFLRVYSIMYNYD
jgi:hypothetical protein